MNGEFSHAFKTYSQACVAASKHPSKVNRKRSRERAYATDRVSICYSVCLMTSMLFISCQNINATWMHRQISIGPFTCMDGIVPLPEVHQLLILIVQFFLSVSQNEDITLARCFTRIGACASARTGNIADISATCNNKLFMFLHSFAFLQAK